MESETVRQTAHVLLDALSTFDDLNNPDPESSVRLALRRLEDVDAVTILYDDETDSRTVDVQPLLHAALGLLAAAVADHMHDVKDLDGVTAIDRLRRVTDLAHGSA